jgi:Ca-activated chloride channel family protein
MQMALGEPALKSGGEASSGSAGPTPASKAVKSDGTGRFGASRDSGSLCPVDAKGRVKGKCVLKHTDVVATVSGYVARVTVEQVFQNPYPESIEAVYTFPLSNTGAVDDMVMQIGDRTIHGAIHKRLEARAIYNQAKSSGTTATLLEQERTNIFTQSVANIPAHSMVKVKISYVDLLPYEKGNYSFVFPMVVGPRYMPGAHQGKSGTGWSEDTSLVPDASKISPPIISGGARSGHDISLKLKINGGMQLSDIESKLHQVLISRPDANDAEVRLLPTDSMPNRDFIVSWRVAQENVHTGYLTYAGTNGRFFNLMFIPPARPKVDQVAPRELNFIVDRSGSQSGLPLQKAKEAMLYILDRLNPNDTFQILSFSSRTEKLFHEPMPPTRQAIAEAKRYIRSLDADGGTEMAHAVEEATAVPAPQHRLRIFTIMTDGYIGDDNDVIALVKKTRGRSRWFAFGTGDSVNHNLIDGVAKAGGGEAQYVLLNSSAAKIGKEFFDRISSPILTDIKLNFEGVKVKDVIPQVLNDVWAERPLYITGKYLTPGKGTMTVSGFNGGKPYKQQITLDLPEANADNSALASIWARAKVDELMDKVHQNSLPHASMKEVQEQIEDLGLKYHLMTDYTSFVAVDSAGKATAPGRKTFAVPVEAPEGVNLPGSGGSHNNYNLNSAPPPPKVSAVQFSRARAVDMASLPPPSALPPPPLPGAANAQASASAAPSLSADASSLRALYFSRSPRMAVASPQPIIRDYRKSPSAISKTEPNGDLIVSDLRPPKGSVPSSYIAGMPTDIFDKLDGCLAEEIKTAIAANNNEALVFVDIEFRGDRKALIEKINSLADPRVLLLDSKKDSTLAVKLSITDILKVAQWEEVANIALHS